jgi:hypothetical protein
MKNLCAKTVKPENAYEIWQNNKPIILGGSDRFEAGTWTWYVLKKYQTPENEAKNQYARWFCLVKTPVVPEGEYGDTYISDIKPYAIRIK